MTADQLAATLRTDPYAFAQYVVDVYYPEVLNRAQADKIVQGDVGPEALYTAIANLIATGNMVAVSRIINIQPSEQDAVIRQLTNGYRNADVASDTSFMDEWGGVISDGINSLPGLLCAITGNCTPQPGPNPAPQPQPLPPAQSGFMGGNNMILIVVAAIAAIGLLVFALRR